MGIYKQILFATDLVHRDNDPIIEKVATLVKIFKARLSLVHVLQSYESPYGTPFVSPNFVEWQKQLEKVAREKLGRLGNMLDVPAEHQLLVSGKPTEALLKTAQDLGADLIVLGSHATSGSGFRLVGSTAAALLHTAQIDVLTVHIG